MRQDGLSFKQKQSLIFFTNRKKTNTSYMVSRRVLLDALTVVRAIEEAIAIDEEDINWSDAPVKLSECDLPDHIVDPFELVRMVRGEEYVGSLEYIGDMEYIAEIIEACVQEELQKKGKKSVEDIISDDEN